MENYFDKISLAETKKSPRFRWINENFPKTKVLEDGLLLNYWKATPTKVAEFKKLGISSVVDERIIKFNKKKLGKKKNN